jgi:hypothetical protein
VKRDLFLGFAGERMTASMNAKTLVHKGLKCMKPTWGKMVLEMMTQLPGVMKTQDERSKERGRLGILKMKNEANSQFPEEKGKGRRREKGRKGEREKGEV